MSREAAQPIPKGIVNARGLVNELASEARIKIEATNPYWQETGILCSPFKGKITYSRENIELLFRITVGRVFDSIVGQEVIEELPFPVNYSYSLEPEPLLEIFGELAVTPDTKKFEVVNFLSNTVILALMATQALMVTDSFTQETTKILSAEKLPKANSLWDFGGLAEKILQ
jgi:hypothetical protein